METGLDGVIGAGSEQGRSALLSHAGDDTSDRAGDLLMHGIPYVAQVGSLKALELSDNELIAVELDGYKLVVAELQGLEAADLRNVWDTVHQKVAGPVACVVASVTEKGTPALLAAGSDDAVKAGFHAGNVIKQIAGLVDGRGGGRPNMAQAGGKNAAGIADALAAAKTALGA